jgi:NAD(P)-dependent dehydrogenase (short-subunit alcohol dehydrogenase family)
MIDHSNSYVGSNGRTMRIENSTALVTGANRGIGREFTRQLMARGARRVYATAREPRLIDIDGAVPLSWTSRMPPASRQHRDGQDES